MYKKSLILLFIITCVNSSFGNNNTTDSKDQFVPASAIDAELFKKLENVDPAQAIHYLTLQQELNQNNKHEANSISKPGMFFTIVLISTASGLASALLLKDNKAAGGIGLTSAIGFFCGLGGMAFTEKTTPYSSKNTEILKKMESIHLTPIMNLTPTKK